LVLRDFCAKCKKWGCVGLGALAVSAGIWGQMHDRDVKPPPAQPVDSILLSTATTGVSATAAFTVVNQVTSERYVGEWPDQRRQGDRRPDRSGRARQQGLTGSAG
jgi:hypothetical protein